MFFSVRHMHIFIYFGFYVENYLQKKQGINKLESPREKLTEFTDVNKENHAKLTCGETKLYENVSTIENILSSKVKTTYFIIKVLHYYMALFSFLFEIERFLAKISFLSMGLPTLVKQPSTNRDFSGIFTINRKSL